MPSHDGVFSLPKEEFFRRVHENGFKLTYDDVRLTDWEGIGNHDPQDTDISTRLTRNVSLNAPWVSAAMDTVTESAMAIAIAKQGGIGVIHASLDVDAQKQEVRRVVHHLNARIETPISAQEDDTLAEIIKMLGERDFRSIPIVDKNDVLKGLLTTQDFIFAREPKKTPAKRVMRPVDELVTGPKDTSIDDAYDIMMTRRVSALPLVDKFGCLSGMYVLSDVLRIKSGLSDVFNTDGRGRLRTTIAVPTREDDALRRIEAMQNHLEVVVLDTAQGDSKYSIRTLKAIKSSFRNLDVLVGNVSSPATARLLAEAGADGIKVGQGPGSICTTRIETGIGSPQVSAVYLCKQAVEKFDIPVCADGGITSNGDISIAIAAGADSVMMGGMLAGTDEAAGERKVLEDGRIVMQYRGMGSASALRDSAAARSRYGSEGATAILPEGVEAQIPYKGSVVNILTAAELALRKSLSYVGAPNIATHQRITPLSRVTNAGMTESRPHV